MSEEGDLNDTYAFIHHIPKALKNDDVANTDKQNSELIPDLAEPIKSGPSIFNIVSTPLIVSFIVQSTLLIVQSSFIVQRCTC